MSLEWFVTDLGDLFCAGAVAMVIVIWAMINLSALTGLAYGVCFAATFGLVTAIKLWTHTHFAEPDQVPLWAPSAGAPSGHAAMVGIVYGASALIFWKVGRGVAGGIGLLLSLITIATVCVTRVTIGAHSAFDVFSGLAVALGFLALFRRILDIQMHGRTVDTNPLLVGMIAVAAIALLAGYRISSGDVI